MKRKPARRTRQNALPSPARRTFDWILAHDVGVLLGLTVVLRAVAAVLLPALTYDGTSYLRRAEDILRFEYDFAGFPPGYPLAVALLLPIVRDAVIAGASVNFAAGTFVVLLLHRLAKRHLSAPLAFAVALFVAVHPYFIRTSVEIWSEPIYMVATLGGILLFESRRFVWSGLLFGYAFLCRPEALPVYAILIGVTARQQRRVPWTFLIGLVPVGLFATLASQAVGHLVITPKSGQFDTGLDLASRLRTLAKMLHNVYPLILVPPAMWHGLRSRSILVLPTLYLGVLPVFDVHIQQRMVLPGVLFLCVLAVRWLVRLNRTERQLVGGSAAVLFLVGVVPEYRTFTWPSIVIPAARQIGEALRPHVDRDDRIAARFPFVSYYAGAGFVRWRPALYPEFIDRAREDGATHALIMEDEIEYVPATKPLFNNAGLVRSDGRIRQVARIDGRYYRSILYELSESPIALRHTTVLREDASRAAWAGDALLATIRGGGIAVATGTPAPDAQPFVAAAASLPIQDLAVWDENRFAVVVRRDAGTSIATWSSAAELVELGQTAADAPRALDWLSADRLLYVTAAGGVRLLDTRTGRVQAVQVLEHDAPAWAAKDVACRRGSSGNIDVALRFTHTIGADQQESWIVTLRWADPPAVDAPITLRPHWSAAGRMLDSGITWVPEHDRLLATYEIPRVDGQGNIMKLETTLCLVDSIGVPRRLTFEFDGVRNPAVRSVEDGAAYEVAFLHAAGTLRTARVPARMLSFPPVKCFELNPERPVLPRSEE
jgi:hypothetical protein